MLARTVLALLLIAFPVAIAAKISAQRRRLGRSPVVLGEVGTSWGERSFERLGPVGLLFWPASWLWVTVLGAPLATGARLHLGLVLMLAGAVLTLASVFLMGRAWRIGIDPTQRSELAEDGPYRWVRHPIYGGWLVTLLGNVLVVPDAVVDVAALLTTLGILYEAVREEQHLLRTFGDRYASYMARTGRFVPRLHPTGRP